MDSTRPKDGVAEGHAEAFARGMGRDKSDAFTRELWRGVLAVVTGAGAFERFVQEIKNAKAAYRCNGAEALPYGALRVLNALAEDQALAAGLTARRTAHVLLASICAFPLRTQERSIRRIRARCARPAFSDLNPFVGGMLAVDDLPDPVEALRDALRQAAEPPPPAERSTGHDGGAVAEAARERASPGVESPSPTQDGVPTLTDCTEDAAVEADRTMSREAKAVGLLSENPGWSNRKVATALGVHHSTVDRMPKVRIIRDSQKGRRADAAPRGHRVRGRGTVDGESSR